MGGAAKKQPPFSIRRQEMTTAVAVFVVFAGVASAQAYEQFNNAAVVLADGKLANLDSVASSYCQAKGFKGAEHYEFSGFMSNSGKANAVFSSVRCTMVANIQPTSNVAKGKNPSNLLTSPGSKALGEAVQGAANKAAIGNAIANHGVVSSSGSGGSSGGSGGGSGPISSSIFN
jgi:hypothetical protein